MTDEAAEQLDPTTPRQPSDCCADRPDCCDDREACCAASPDAEPAEKSSDPPCSCACTCTA